jgi:hypothetical protein
MTNPWPRRLIWFLAVSYVAAAPVMVVLESRSALFSQRFDLPAWLIYGTVIVQVASVLLILSNRYAATAALALSATTLGAFFSHIRIGSPFNALPALAFTVAQLWLAAQLVRGHGSGRVDPSLDSRR